MPHDQPRLEILKRQALEMGLSRDAVREFGSLSRRKTWESAIAFHTAVNDKLDRWEELDIVDNVIHNKPSKPHDTRTLSLLNFPQLVALLVAVGLFCVFLLAPLLRRIPPIFPIKITIQIGANK